MYLYVYDEFVQEKKFEREVQQVENRLTDLGISGKIIRLALFRAAHEQIRDEARRGASTVVIVGNDRTVRKVLDAVTDADLPLGLIPIGSQNNFAKMLGIPGGVAACDVLSARNIAAVDTGLLNGKRFVTGVRIPHDNTTVTCEGRYKVQTGLGGKIEIRNLCALDSDRIEDVGNPQDGLLEIRIDVPSNSGWLGGSRVGTTKLPIKFATIEAPNAINAVCDGEVIQGSSFQIGVDPMALKVITGRGKMF